MKKSSFCSWVGIVLMLLSYLRSPRYATPGDRDECQARRTYQGRRPVLCGSRRMRLHPRRSWLGPRFFLTRQRIWQYNPFYCDHIVTTTPTLFSGPEAFWQYRAGGLIGQGPVHDGTHFAFARWDFSGAFGRNRSLQSQNVDQSQMRLK